MAVIRMYMSGELRFWQCRQTPVNICNGKDANWFTCRIRRCRSRPARRAIHPWSSYRIGSRYMLMPGFFAFQRHARALIPYFFTGVGFSLWETSYNVHFHFVPILYESALREWYNFVRFSFFPLDYALGNVEPVDFDRHIKVFHVRILMQPSGTPAVQVDRRNNQGITCATFTCEILVR